MNIVNIFAMLIFVCGQITCFTKQRKHLGVQFHANAKKTEDNIIQTALTCLLFFFVISTLTKAKREKRNSCSCGSKLQEIIFLLRDYSGGESGLGKCNQCDSLSLSAVQRRLHVETITHWPLRTRWCFLTGTDKTGGAHTLTTEKCLTRD